jgi:hypothetical protein
MTIAALRSAQAGAILTTLGLSAGLMLGVAEAAPPIAHHCLSPIFSGGPVEWRDLNLRYNVSERIIGPPDPATDDTASPGCLEAFAGEKWVRAVPPWITAKDAATAVYPDDYKPEERLDPNPIADFKLKFRGARYVIDEGTDEEKTVTAGPEILRTGSVPSDPDVSPPFTRGLPFSVPVSPVLNPLSIGGHTSTLYVTMADKDGTPMRHCNGLSTAAPGLSANCLPGGESKWPISTNLPFKFSPSPSPSPGG